MPMAKKRRIASSSAPGLALHELDEPREAVARSPRGRAGIVRRRGVRVELEQEQLAVREQLAVGLAHRLERVLPARASPRAAASANASWMRSLSRSTSATARSFFVGKSRNR